jgi:PAS domain S-box-containing protein
MVSQGTILVVDDDEAVLLATASVLRKADYHVREARSGSECLAMASTIHPELILLDVVLPDIDGFQVAEKLAQDPATASILITFCTARKKSEDDRVSGLDLGGHDYIVRPISNRELVARVRALLRLAEAERGRRDSEAQFRAIFDRAGVGIATVSVDGVILASNPALRHMLGYSEAELRGMTLAQLTHAEDYAGEVQLARDLLDGRIETYQLDKRYIRKDGCIMWGRLTTSLVHGHAGKVEYAIGMVDDITRLVHVQMAKREIEQRHHEAEEKSWRHLAQLAAVSRLNVLGEAAASFAHELNQPLCSIQAAVQAGFQGVSASEPNVSLVRRSLKLIAEQTRLAGEIIARIRSRTRQPERRKAPSDINALVRESVAMLAHEAERSGIVISVQLDEALPQVVVEPVEIEQVLLNLIRNGLEAMAEVESDRRLMTITTTVVSAGKQVQVCVTDQGCGLSDRVRESLFEPFLTTKIKGMGIGLAISKSIIEAHQGHISAVSDAGGGSTFCVVLPVSHEPLPPAER